MHTVISDSILNICLKDEANGYGRIIEEAFRKLLRHGGKFLPISGGESGERVDVLNVMVVSVQWLGNNPASKIVPLGWTRKGRLL